MKIALIQIDSTDNKDSNAQKAEDYIAKAAAQGANIVCLAEDFLCKSDVVIPEDLDSSRYIAKFKKLAKELGINVVLGSMILASSEGKPTNTSLIIDSSGQIVHKYSKQHMYDVERSDFTYHESDEVEPGNKLGIFTLEGVTMGVGICVDLRYPEYFRELMQAGAEIVFLPTNMRKVTGGRAWEVLTKARSIENQFYLAACGQIGQTGVKERVGNSRIVSFDGQILSEIGEEEGLVIADLDLEALRAFRKEFPVLKQVK
jgi:predicted amidohydrolase